MPEVIPLLTPITVESPLALGLELDAPPVGGDDVALLVLLCRFYKNIYKIITIVFCLMVIEGHKKLS